MSMRDISKADLDRVQINWATDFTDADGQPFGPGDCLRCNSTLKVVRVVGKDWSARTTVVQIPIGSRFVLTAAEIKAASWVRDDHATSKWIEKEEREDEWNFVPALHRRKRLQGV